MTSVALSSDSPLEAPAWSALSALAAGLASTSIRSLIDSDPSRPERLTLDAVGLSLDFSRQRVTDEVLTQLCALAEQRGVATARSAMLDGVHINNTEDRAVLDRKSVV